MVIGGLTCERLIVGGEQTDGFYAKRIVKQTSTESRWCLMSQPFT